MIKTQNLFDLSKSAAGEFIASFGYPWLALKELGGYFEYLCNSLNLSDYSSPAEFVFIHKSADVSDSATIKGPCIIGAESTVRHCAFIRGNVLIGESCVVGNSTEVKNSVLFDKVQIPHFNYVGDSILGFGAHFGAGVITSNVKCDKTEVSIDFCGERIMTGMRKFGALVGDKTEVGCNSVLNPGTVIGRESLIYPLSNVRGYVDEYSIYKSRAEIIGKVR